MSVDVGAGAGVGGSRWPSIVNGGSESGMLVLILILIPVRL
jgi:hypothetical protein